MPRERYIKEREDYRSGGRVSLARGTRNIRRRPTTRVLPEEPIAQISPAAPVAQQPAVPAGQTGTPGRNISSPKYEAAKAEAVVEAASRPRQSRPNRRDYNSREEYQAALESEGWRSPTIGLPVQDDKPPTEDEILRQQFETERGERVLETGRTAKDIAEGKIPAGAIQKPDIAKVGRGRRIKDKTGKYRWVDPYKADTKEIAEQDEIIADTIDSQDPELVTKAEDTAQAPDPTAMQAVTMPTSLIEEPLEISGVTGTISDDAIAEAAEVGGTPSIDAADVQIKEGALAERVVGTLSPQAMAIAAQAAGTTLSKVTRAKKQLRNAGVTEEDIEELGNDPEALEARLMDLTQEERGVIGDLPEEALVSNQLDSLLKGMESGEIPTWAGPAVSAVEQMLAQRGLEASSVGRDNLFNAIIQSAMPLAQSNAQAIQQSVAQTRDIESREELANVQMRQQTALQNASNVFQMDMAQFSADQQTELSNSKFLQTASLTEANNDQQAAIQNALILSQSNLAEASMRQQTAIQNAKSFLTMDMANLNNEQQATLVTAQYQQQTMLSNQAAENAAAQFNATSENQTNQFMASLSTQINQYNASALNQAKLFNAQASNAASARDATRIADVNKANAAILNQTSQFNAQMDFNRNQWNAANAQAVENSNVNWRRQANTINTAAQNAVNQQNAQNAFSMSSTAQSFLWQELRDQADYDFKWANNTADRKMQAMVAAAGAEGDAARNWSANYEAAAAVVDEIFGTGE